MYTLGLNAAYHDPAACLVKDGQVIAAVEEERFTHVKHGKRAVPFSTYELPFNAINYCLSEAGIILTDVDHIAYSYDPYLLLGGYRQDEVITLPLEPSAHPTPDEWEAAWDPLFLSSIVNAPRHLVGGPPHHLQARFNGARLQGDFQWHYVEHHLAHAASAFLASPFHEAAVMTLDGRGERATTTYNLGEGNYLRRLGQVDMPHSLGMLYERVTEYLGFLPSSDEGKVMALASYGEPRFVEAFRDMVSLEDSGCYTIAPLRLEERFGPARRKGDPLKPHHFDIAYSLQAVLEETALELAHWLHQSSGSDYLCLAGGVALNCVLNARLRDRGPFEDVWVQPAAGDSGTALGAALWIDAHERATDERRFTMDHAFYGPGFDDNEIREFLDWSKLSYRQVEVEEVAELLAEDKVVGWFQGRMEFGPRALGARSFVASPMRADMLEHLNDIKGREGFRPVAPVVLEEEAGNWFAGPRGANGVGVSPYMLFVYDVLEDKADLIPAVRHVDGTARVQTINRSQHPQYYDLLKAFQARTGVPVLVNTSFNTRGEPIVCSPRDAVECFWTSPIDALAIGSFLLEK